MEFHKTGKMKQDQGQTAQEIVEEFMEIVGDSTVGGATRNNDSESSQPRILRQTSSVLKGQSILSPELLSSVQEVAKTFVNAINKDENATGNKQVAQSKEFEPGKYEQLNILFKCLDKTNNDSIKIRIEKKLRNY